MLRIIDIKSPQIKEAQLQFEEDTTLEGKMQLSSEKMQLSQKAERALKGGQLIMDNPALRCYNYAYPINQILLIIPDNLIREGGRLLTGYFYFIPSVHLSKY